MSDHSLVGEGMGIGMTNDELKSLLREGTYAIRWRKKSGEETVGVLTRDVSSVPEESKPKGGEYKNSSYVPAYCFQRGRWCSLLGESVVSTDRVEGDQMVFRHEGGRGVLYVGDADKYVVNSTEDLSKYDGQRVIVLIRQVPGGEQRLALFPDGIEVPLNKVEKE